MNPIAKTAFYCAALRMLDASSDNPICADDYAEHFANDDYSNLLERFQTFEQHRIANLFRHRIIDDIIKTALAGDAATAIILVGAGFDTRAYRIHGGRWYEIDEPEIIDYKTMRLPASACDNPLTRIPHAFSEHRLEQTLQSCKICTNVFIIVEGVLRYLEESEIRSLVRDLTRVFPTHCLVCDLMSRRFFEEYGGGTTDVLKELGAPTKFHAINPQQLFKDAGYRLTDMVSVIETAIASGEFPETEETIEHAGTLFDGYSVCRFELP